MATKQKTEVAKAPETAVAVLDPSVMAEDAALGREQMSAEDMALPYLLVLQSLSPQVKKSSPQRVDDAEEGDIYNNVSGELFDSQTGIEVIPCAFRKAWVEWAPRDTGGGFVDSHDDASILEKTERDERGFDVRTDNGNIIVATFYYYVLMVKGELLEPAIVSMSRTQMKVGRRWNNLISSVQVKGPQGMFNPPMFAQRYQLSTEPVSNAKGEWYNWKVASLGLVSSPDVYAKAKEFTKLVSTGAVKVAPPPDSHDEETTDASVF